MNDSPDYIGDAEPYYDTPPELIDYKLQLAGLKPDQLLMDLGCGNGMVLVRAVQQYGVRGTGCDMLEEALTDAASNIEAAGLTEKITLLKQDFRTVDVSQADALVLYHGRNTLNTIMLAIEDQLKPGAIVVTHDFDISCWSDPEHFLVTLSGGATHDVFRYVVT